MKRNHPVLLLLAAIIFILMATINNAFDVKAASVPSTTQAYQNAPKGMKLDGYVDIPSSYKYKTGTSTFPSSSKLITDYQTNIIQMITTSSSKTNQIGSFWGTIKEDNGNKTYNYFDLNKDQEISAWIYNGSDNSKAIDGFAFVLQNDPLGSQAISRIGGTPTAGQTLGVWGNAAGEGIKNSVALEFDRYQNSTDNAKENYDNNTYSTPIGQSASFSKAIKDQHISWGYPGNGDSYTGANILMHRRTPLSVTNAVPMAGYDGVFLPPTGNEYDPKDSWRHILIDYKADTKTIYYKFNDKYPDGTSKMSGLVNSGNFVIDPSELGASDGKVYWGFTAATGSSKSGIQDVAMVMEKMPAIAEVKAPVDLHDLTTDQSSSEMGTTTNSQGIQVYNPLSTYDDDKLQFEYDLQYVDGISETGKVDTQIALPENVDYQGDETGNIGSIIYLNPDGTEQKREGINKSQIEKVTVTVPSTDANLPPTSKTIDGLKLQLDSLKDPKAKIQILINGIASAPVSSVAQITSVNGEHTSYRSDNYSGDVISPAFTINNDNLVIDNTSSLSQQVSLGKSPKLTGTVETSLKSALDDQGLIATTQVYDAENKLISLDQSTVPILTGSTQGQFDLSVDTSSLTPKETYTARVTLHDQKGRVSNTLIYSFTIQEKELLLDLYGNNKKIFEKGSDIPIDYKSYYKTGSGTEVADLDTVEVYRKIDDGDWEKSEISSKTDDSIFKNTIAKNTLSPGEHTTTLYLSDGVRESNKVSYDFTVIDYGLVLTPKEKEITVKNNDPVDLAWEASYSKDSGMTEPLGKVTKATLQIRNLDQPDMQEFKDFDIYKNMASTFDPITVLNPTFSFDLNPIGLEGKNPLLNHLKEGRNEIKMSVRDNVETNDFTSNEATMIINVPKLTLQVESDSPDYYTTNLNFNFRIGMKYNYLEDETYTTDLETIPSSLVGTVSYEDQSKDLRSRNPVADNDSEKRTFKLDGIINNFKLEKGQTYAMQVHVTDPYQRVSNDVPFNFHYLDKYLNLDVDDYNFKDIKYNDAPDALIQRSGNWKVSVDSAGSVWDLYAQSSGVFKDGYKKDLVFVDSNGIQRDMNSKQNIWSRETAISGQSATDDISANWSDDEGILLRNNKPDLAGEYSGEIDWSLEDVPK